MALGTDGLITVVGDIDTITDASASGTLTVVLSAPLPMGTKLILPIERQVALNDADGTFSIKLPPTGTSGVTYRFTLDAYASVAGNREHYTESFDAVLTADSADANGIVQYLNLIHVAVPGVPQTYLTRTVADGRYALKGESGGGGGGSINLSGYVTDQELAQALANLGGGSGLDAAAVRALVKGYLKQGANVTLTPDDNAGTLTISAAGGTGGTTTITIASITDATTVGKALLGAASTAAARTAIGAGTSNLAVGTSATDAKRGDYVATWAELGTVPTSSLPPLAINDVFTVASQAAMLALTAQRGDMAIRTDTGATFVLASDSPTTLADWKSISAAGAVNSVNGKTGTIVLAPSDIAGFATVATSGSYGDLANKPTIPAAATTASVLALLPNMLKNWARIPIDMAVGTITYNASGAPTGHSVEWPDGATGVYAGTASTTFPGSIDTYTVTHVLSGTTTTTYTQPTVTRDATTGQVTARPAVTVA